MKRIVRVVAVLLAVMLVLGACKVVDPCPAYETSVDVVQNETNV